MRLKSFVSSNLAFASPNDDKTEVVESHATSLSATSGLSFVSSILKLTRQEFYKEAVTELVGLRCLWSNSIAFRTASNYCSCKSLIRTMIPVVFCAFCLILSAVSNSPGFCKTMYSSLRSLVSFSSSLAGPVTSDI